MDDGLSSATEPVASHAHRLDELARDAAARPGLLSFAGGLPDPLLFPRRELSRAFVAAVSSPRCAALQYGWPEGAEELRTWVARRFRRRGANVQAGDVIITSGAQQGVLTALAAAPRKDTIAVDDESYPGALAIFRAAGARLVSRTSPAALHYVMPSVSNPRGLRMPEAARRALLQTARQHDSYIIEDDAYDETCFSGPPSRPLLADAPDRVFHVGTFSKTLSPGLRVGWLVTPKAFHEGALQRKQNQDLQASSLSQELVVEYLRNSDYEGHLRRLRRHYSKKRDVLAAKIREHLPALRATLPEGGFSLFLEGEEDLSGDVLLAAAIEEGVSFDAGESFRREPSKRLALRLCYSTVAPGDIETGVIRLARALRRV